jgi:formate hydrogenlyase transcriptional activator
LARGDWEKGLLLSLSKDLASVRQKEHLIAAVKKTLKSALDFSHIAICLKAEHRIISFALDPDSKIKDRPEYQAATRENIPFNDAWVKIFEESIEPVIIKKSDLHDAPELSPIMKLNFDCGINEMIITKLYDGVRYFGFWVTFNESESTGTLQIKFIQSIANQMSTALLNVLANQEIADRDEDKEYLIQLGNAMAGIRSYSEFSQFVNRECAAKFGFDRSSIVIAEPDSGSVVKVLGNDRQEKNLAKLSAEGSLEFQGKSGELHSLLTGNSSFLIVDPKEPQSLPYFDLLGLHPAHPDKVIITKFHHRNRILGAWIMYYPQQMEIASRSLRLMEAVSAQLSVVIENIFADEREALFASQKSILFSLSQHVSAARDLNNLLDAMDQHVRSVLGYYHTNFNLLHEDKISLMPWNDRANSVHEAQSEWQMVSLAPLNDLIEQVLLTTEPRLFDLSDQKSTGLGRYNHLEGQEDHKVSHALLTRLEVKGEVLGLWVICFESRPALDKDYLNLVKGIRDTLSLGILNIILNERISRREQEKSGLLDFSKAVAGVKDKFQLGTIFHTYLKNLCNLEEVCLHWLDDNRDMQYCYLWDPDSTYADDPEFDAVTSVAYPVNDGVLDQLLISSAPLYIDIDEICSRPVAPYYFKFLQKHGFLSVVALPIFKGDDIAGILFVKKYDLGEADQPLFRSLSSQLAIAVSDLIATERVVQQLAEINSYKERLEEEKVYLTQELEITHNYSEIIGNSPALSEVFKMISQVAVSESTVLILGETGTGKELIARAIHNDSPRKNNMLVKVNCAALPANLIESELFGHEKGSFTGATERRVGKFELANGGTLFLDEIGEMPPELQVKLLRALQEKEIERIGGKGTIKADVRIVAATNRNLEQEINAGRFRTDLYFRISTFPIHLPALRDRTEDIPLLAMHFVRRFAKRSGKVIENISGRAMNELLGYSWPGNVRELEHQIERCVLMTSGSTIKEVHLPSTVQSGGLKEISTAKFIPGVFDDFEKDYILKTLKYCNGKVSGTGGAAEILGIPSSTLTSRMKRLNITKKIVEKLAKG